jgi:serine/threonine protein kinase
LLRFFVRCTSNNVADAPPPCKNFGRMKLDARALIGRTLNATYRLVRPIGSGGMGAILEAQNARLAHKRYAVKLLHPSLAMDPDTFHRFRREAEIASSLGHDHIVEVHDFNVTPEGEPYMVMEFLDGDDLAARIKARGPMSLAETSFILTQVASALEAAHAAGIVHRDLKPQNIFLCKRFGRDDFVKVLDFGVSKMRDSSSVVTRDHSLLGTPFYMSPEQADGRVAEIDRRTDVFALGALLYEMLTGQMAFFAERRWRRCTRSSTALRRMCTPFVPTFPRRSPRCYGGRWPRTSASVTRS